MAKGLNRVMLIGRLGKAIDAKFTQGGLAVASFSIATSEQWNDKQSGEKKEKTEWHRIVSFGKLAEICIKYLDKGSNVYVEGKLQTRSWEQDGVTKYTTEIVITDMQMLDSKQSTQRTPDSQQNNSGSGGGSGYYSQTGGNQPEPPDFDDGDQIPF